MKEQHRYGIIFSVLLVTIAFIFNDYLAHNSHANKNIREVLENINDSHRITEDFLSEVVSLGEFTASEAKLLIVESKFDGKSNKANHNLYDGKNYYSSKNIEELLISKRDKDESIKL